MDCKDDSEEQAGNAEGWDEARSGDGGIAKEWEGELQGAWSLPACGEQ